MADIIAARYGMSPFQVWSEFSLRQIVIAGNLAARARWREHAFLLALHGGKPGREPVWNFGFEQKQHDREMEELRAYIARKNEKAGGDGGKQQ